MLKFLCGWAFDDSGWGGGASGRAHQYEVASVVGEGERQLMIDLIVGEVEAKLAQISHDWPQSPPPSSDQATARSDVGSVGSGGSTTSAASGGSSPAGLVPVDYSWLVGGGPKCRRRGHRAHLVDRPDCLTPGEKADLEAMIRCMEGDEYGKLIGAFRKRFEGCRNKADLMQVFRFTLNEIVNARPRDFCWADRLKLYLFRNKNFNSICDVKTDSEGDQLEMINRRRQDGSQLTMFDLV